MTKKNERKKKRTVRLRLTNTRHGTGQSEQLYAAAERRSVLGKMQLAVGVWQHPVSGLWQVWVSLYGSDVTWISAHRDADRAHQDVEEIQAAALHGDLYDENKVAALAKHLAQGGIAEPQDMSADELAKVIAYIKNMTTTAQPSQEELTLVMVELAPGKVGIGFRLGHSDTVDLIAEDLSAQEAIQFIADMSSGRADAEELSHRPMRSVFLPIQDESEPAVTYKYTLPQDDEEVIVSGIAMTILDRVKLPPLRDADARERRALWHCEQSREHCRVPLTNDYEGFKQLFISSYTRAYNTRELGKMSEIVNRYPIDVALAEIRNIIKGIYFPERADLDLLITEYKGTRMTPHRSLGGYYATFVWNQAVQRTPDMATPIAALAQAEQMIEELT